MALNLTQSSLAPVIVALLVLVSLSLFGLAVAWWPEEQAEATVRELRNQAALPQVGPTEVSIAKRAPVAAHLEISE